MRPLFLSIVLVAALAVPVAASADTPPPAVVAACQAEYQQLGKDAFVAKYGQTEPFGHCYQQHAAPTPAPAPAPSTTTPADNPLLAACKAEYQQLGPEAFAAKYGTTETLGNCLKSHGATDARPPSTTTTDNPALAACKAEYLQLGPDAFAAKYGKTETLGNCLKSHGGTDAPPPPATTTTDNPALAACKTEYLQLGPDAFAAKYGKTETLGNCVKAHSGTQPAQTTPPPKPKGDDGAASVAAAFCQSQLKTLGKDAFAVTYGGNETMGACLKSALVNARALVASCRSSSGSSTSAFKACIAAGLSPKRR